MNRREESFKKVTDLLEESFKGSFVKEERDYCRDDIYTYKGESFIVELTSSDQGWGSDFVSVDKFHLKFTIENAPCFPNERHYFSKRLVSKNLKLDMKDVLKKLDKLIVRKDELVRIISFSDKYQKEKEIIVSENIRHLVCALGDLETERRYGDVLEVGKGLLDISVNDKEKPYSFKGTTKSFDLIGITELVNLMVQQS